MSKAYNMTNRRNMNYISVPLESLKGWKEGSTNLKHLIDNNILTTKDFFEKVKSGEIYSIVKEEKKKNNVTIKKPVFTDSNIKAIKGVIEQNLISLPGLEKETYDLLAKNDIKTLRDFEFAYTNKQLPSTEGTNVTDNDYEEVKMLTERSNNPALMRVYHSSADINCATYVINHEWKDGPNSQAYGSGIYACWTKSSSFHNIDVFGRRLLTDKENYAKWVWDRGGTKYIDKETGQGICFRFEFLVDVKDYFIYNYEVYKQTHPEDVDANEHNFLEHQNKKFGTNYTRSAQSDFWGFWWRDKSKNPHYQGDAKKEKADPLNPCIRGVIFNGGNDGDVVVIYDSIHAIPMRFSKGDEEKWINIGDASYASSAAQAASGIMSESSLDAFWLDIQDKFKTAVSQIIEDVNGAGDMNEKEFVSSEGKNYIIQDSLDDDPISGPESSDYGANKVFDKFEIKDCLYAKSYQLPFHEVNQLNIVNAKPADCQMITSFNTTLTVNDQIWIKNCPDANIPWSSIVCPDSNTEGKLKFHNVGINSTVNIKNFNQAYFIHMNIGNFEPTGPITDDTDVEKNDKLRPRIVCDDCRHIVFKKVTSDCINLILTSNDIEHLTFTDCNINRVNIFALKEGMSIKTLTLSGGNLVEEFAFIVQTSKHTSIYKKDDAVRDFVYSDTELIDALSSKEEDSFIDEFHIGKLEVN